MIRTTVAGRLLTPLAADRLVLTTLTTLSLWGMFMLYAHTTRPLLKSEITVQKSVIPDDEPRFPSATSELANASLPNEDWLDEANYRMHNERSLIYFHRRKLLDDNTTLQVSPFALVILPKPGDDDPTPITMVCESARLNFDSEFDLTDVKPEGLQGGALQGNVKITGPKQLAIVGSDFQFSKALRIWSDRSVAFQYDRHVGDALGVEIRMKGDPEQQNRGMLAATDVESISLRKNVRMNVYLKGEENDLLRIRANGNFEFNFDTNLAEFHRNVSAERPTGQYERETLDCDILRLQFAEREELEDGKTVRRMEPIRFSADGRSVVLKSDKHKIKATASHLTYDVELKTITLIGAVGTVDIQHEHQTFVGKRIDIVHDDDSNVVSADAIGPGSLVELIPDTGKVQFAAGWQSRFTFGNDPHSDSRLATMVGDAIVQQPADETSMTGQTIRMWFHEKPAEPEGPGETDSADDRRITFNMQPDKLVAEGGVRIKSPQLVVGAERPADKLTANFTDADSPQLPIGGDLARRTSGSQDSDEQAAEQINASVADQLDLDARDIIIQLQRPADGKGKTSASDVWLSGDVVVKYRRPDQSPTEFSGNDLHLRNKGGDNQFVTLRGLPGRVKSQGRVIEGEQIEFDRITEKAKVLGKGHIQLLIDRDLEGNKLAVPQPLDVKWTDSMSFEGQIADFHGDVHARMVDGTKQVQEVRSKRMTVEFDERISVTDPDKLTGDEQPELSNIRFNGNVAVKSAEYVNGDITAAQVGSFRELTLEMKSGDLFAQGPGWIKSWRPGRKGRANLSPVASVKANTPLQSTTGDLEFAWIDFIGRMKGNVNRRITEFYDEVRVVYGPVTKIRQEINPDDDRLLQLPKNSGLMRCNRLALAHREAAEDEPGYLFLKGNGNVVLEGHDFRAQADQITFDQLKKQFNLQSLGRANATVWRQADVGAEASSAEGRRIVFNPSTGKLSTDGAQNVSSLPESPTARPAAGRSR